VKQRMRDISSVSRLNMSYRSDNEMIKTLSSVKKVTLSVLNYYNVNLLPIQDVVVMKLHTKSTCFTKLVVI
jgi:hypothetical protein